MRVQLKVDLGEVDIEVQTDGMSIEHIWANGMDCWDATADGLICTLVGYRKIVELAAQEEMRILAEGRKVQERTDEL